MTKKIIAVIILLILSTNLKAQSDSTAFGNVEIYLIDSFITPEIPHKLVVSFFTSDTVKSQISLIGLKDFKISDKFIENHKIEIDLSRFENLSTPLKYRIYVQDVEGEKSRSQIYEAALPKVLVSDNDRNLGMLQVCCFGGVIFGLPSPTYVSIKGQNYFGLSKEIPLFSFYSGGYNYPVGYFGVEYSYIFKAERKNFLRVGYKHIFQTDFIKFISPGVNYFTDFKGYNGISPEITFGLFQIQNVFTLFTRYRFNFQPGAKGSEFNEVSIGLYSNFFSINF